MVVGTLVGQGPGQGLGVGRRPRRRIGPELGEEQLPGPGVLDAVEQLAERAGTTRGPPPPADPLCTPWSSTLTVSVPSTAPRSEVVIHSRS